MRKRRNKKNKQIYLVLFFVLFSLLLSTGYSLFSEILNTNGSVSLMPYVGGNVLNVNLLQTAGRYAVGTPADNSFQSETLNSNNLITNFRRIKSTGKTNYNRVTINFTNAYHLNLTAGSVSTQLISGSSNVSAHSASLSKATLIPNESGSLTLNFSNRLSNAEIIQIRATMRYTVNGDIQYFYYDLFIY